MGQIRPSNASVRRVLRDASMAELLELREIAWQTGLTRLARASTDEIKRRTLVEFPPRPQGRGVVRID